MTQPFDPYQHGQQQARAPGWAPPGVVPDARQWQQVPQFGAYPPPPPAPRKKRKWPWIVAGLFFLLVVVPSIANSGKSSTAQSGSSPSSFAYTPPPVIKAAPAAVPGTAAPAPAAAPFSDEGDTTSGAKASFGDGTWVVGEDIQPGTYKSSGAASGIIEYCSVTTLAGDTSDSKIIDWLTANADEPMRVKVTGKVKAVKASGCEDFVKVG